MKPQQQKLHSATRTYRRVDSIVTFKITVKGQIYTVNSAFYDNREIFKIDFDTVNLRENVNILNYLHYDTQEISVYFTSLDALKLWTRKNVKHWQSRNAKIDSHLIAALTNADETGLNDADCKALKLWEKAQPLGYSVEIVSNHLHDAICDISKQWTDRAQAVTIHWRA